MSDSTVPAPVERWLPVVGYEGLYEVSDLGSVRSLPRASRWRGGKPRVVPARIMSVSFTHRGYRKLTLTSAEHVERQWRVCRIVATAFHGPPGPGMEVDHLNCVKADDRATNLEWVSRQANAGRAAANNLYTRFNGSDHGLAKLTEAQVLEIRALYPGSGLSQEAFGALYGVRGNMVSRIVRRKNWTHV